MRAGAPLAAILFAASAARASPFCDAQNKAAAGAAIAFVDVRGPAVTSATDGSDVYVARLALPDATGCSVFVPRGADRSPPVYACSFSGGVDVKRAMGRLVRRSARCAGVGVGNPPRLKDGPDGPHFYFPGGVARFDFSATRTPGRPGLWTVTLAISKGPHPPRRPFA